MIEEAESLLAFAENHPEMRMEDRRIIVEVLRKSEMYLTPEMHKRFVMIRDSVQRSLSRNQTPRA